ncbi:uncharacterized protein [Aquarana catesbeiana]|uniref:uncharacterized protein isoform X4 n=1 Tax=Aquarana catesbeiana TaxID=8400 RepID=UPI003CC9AA4F
MRLGIFSFQDFSQRLKTQHGYEVYILHFFHLAYSKYWGICQYKHVSHDYGAKEKYNASSATRLDLTLGVFARGSDIDVNCSADLGDMIAGELTTIYWIINGNFSEYYQKAKCNQKRKFHLHKLSPSFMQSYCRILQRSHHLYIADWKWK